MNISERASETQTATRFCEEAWRILRFFADAAAGWDNIPAESASNIFVASTSRGHRISIADLRAARDLLARYSSEPAPPHRHEAHTDIWGPPQDHAPVVFGEPAPKP